MLHKNFQHILRYIPLILVTGGIIYLSSREGLQSDFSQAIDNILRKGAHVFEYFLLFHAMWFAWYGKKYLTLPFHEFSKASAVVISASLLFALSDEYHQIFVPGRTAQPMDIVFDSIGIVGGYLMISLIWEKNRKR